MLRPMNGVTRFWQELHHCFDPSEPVAVDQPELHAEREPRYNAIAKLERRLSAPTQDRHRCLLTGAIGNGKSSELNFFASRLARERIVIVLDLWAHIRNRVGDAKAIDRLQMWELLGLIGLAICRAGTDHFGHRWQDEPKALEQALAVLRGADKSGAEAEIDVLELARGITLAVGGAVDGPLVHFAGQLVGDAAVKASVAVTKAASETSEWSWKLGLLDSKPRGDQEGEVRAVLNAVNRLIGGLQHDIKRPLFLIIDGLNRISDAERTKALFVESSLLGELICDQLLTAPQLLMRRQGQHDHPFALTDLYNVPVLDRTDPRKPGPGVGFFRDIVERRVAHVRRLLAAEGLAGPQDPLPDPIVERLAYYSGGLARDFIKLVRGVALEALLDQRQQIDDAIVDQVLREARTAKEYYMSKDEIALLEQVMRDPERRLPAGDAALDLLVQERLLAYPNDTTWYYPHPLLTLALLVPRPGSPS
jgi:hypothetical protein